MTLPIIPDFQKPETSFVVHHMADPFILIDGYNLMHAAGLFRRRYGPGQFEKSRDQFLGYVSARLMERERNRTTIVFDSPESHRRAASTMTFALMRIIYADSAVEADDVLEDLIRAHSAPRQILLISSDHRLQKAAKRRRGKFLDSEDFVTQLEDRGEFRESEDGQFTADPKQTGLQSQAEIDAWMRVFGEIPDDGPSASPSSARPSKPTLRDTVEREFDIDAWQREIDEMQ